MKTIIRKSCYGTWMAETMAPITDDLHICFTTMKRFDRNLTTTATVGKKDGFFFTYEPFKDFNQTLISSSTRCTKPAVEKQHSTALAMLDTIRTAALTHYN
jgi:hypothetical protein